MLYIEVKNTGEQLDLNQDDVTAISLNFNEVDLSLRKSNYSKSLFLPSTKTNDKFFKYYYNLDVGKEFIYDTAKSVDVTLLDGNNIIIDGILELKSVTQVDGHIIYKIVIYDNVKKLFNVLDESLLNELDFSKYNHKREESTIVLSQENLGVVNDNQVPFSLGEGYRYPHIFAQEYPNTSKMLVSSQFPALFLKEYIDEIFNSNGFTYTSTFLNTDSFKQIIIPSDKNKLEFQNEDDVQDFLVKNDTEGSISTSLFSTTSLNVTKFIDLNLDTVVEGTEEDWVNDYYYEVPFDATYNISVTQLFRAAYENTVSDRNVKGYDADITPALFLYKEDSLGVVTTLASDITGFDLPNEISIDEDETYFSAIETRGCDYTGYLREGEKLYTRVQFRRSGVEYWESTRVNGKEKPVKARLYRYNYSASFDVPSQISVKLDGNDRGSNTEISMAEVIPSIKQKDLVSEVIKTFNLRVIPNSNQLNNFIIEPYNKLYVDDKREVVNWTEKVDYASEIEITPNKFDFNKFMMSYKDAKDYLSSSHKETYGINYGDCVINLDNDFNENDKEYKSKFSSTIPALSYSDRIMPYFIEVNEEQEFSKATVGLRMLFWAKDKTSCEVYNWYDSVTEIDSNITGKTDYSVYRKVTHISSEASTDFDLNFFSPAQYYQPIETIKNDNIFNVFHSTYFEQLTSKESRIVKMKINLTSLDLHKLYPTNLIQIRGNYYTILNISNWDKNKATCDVELLKNTRVSKFVTESYKAPKAEVCPLDIKKRKTWRGTYFYSNSGQPITTECCSSLGGSLDSGGRCFTKKNYDIYNSSESAPRNMSVWFPLPVSTWNTNNRGFYVPYRTDSNNNYFSGAGSNFNFVRGSSNNVYGEHSFVFGNGNLVPTDTKSVFIIGDNIVADKGDGIYFGDSFLSAETGQFENTSQILIWDGGHNMVYDEFKTNDEDILNGGEDDIMNQSDVSREDANYFDGNAPFATD